MLATVDHAALLLWGGKKQGEASDSWQMTRITTTEFNDKNNSYFLGDVQSMEQSVFHAFRDLSHENDGHSDIWLTSYFVLHLHA